MTVLTDNGQHWHRQRIEGEYARVYLNGTELKRCWAGEIKNVPVLAAIGGDKGLDDHEE